MWGVGNRTLYALDVSTPDVGGQGGGGGGRQNLGGD